LRRCLCVGRGKAGRARRQESHRNELGFAQIGHRGMSYARARDAGVRAARLGVYSQITTSDPVPRMMSEHVSQIQSFRSACVIFQLSRQLKRHNSTSAALCGTIYKRETLAPGKNGERHAF
jgi:hypothetical protein